MLKDCVVCGRPAVKKGYCVICWPAAEAKNQAVLASITGVVTRAEASENAAAAR